jgi:phosphoglycerate dehydrogenase-like enzyme
MRVALGRVGILESPGGRRLQQLRPDWEFVEGHRDDWAALVQEADAVVPMMSPVTDAVLAGSRARLVQQFGIGLDTIDLDACRRRGIPVANVPGDVSGNADSVAEIAVAALLWLARDLDSQREAARTGGAGRPVRAFFGRSVVLIGLGTVGAATAKRLAPFGVTVTAVRAHPEQGGAEGVDRVVGADRLDEVLATADAVVCAAPPPADGPLFTADRFALLPEGAAFVNIARGGLVDETALLAALDSGRVGGAALDVFQHEPPEPADPLVSHPRVIATPHIAGVTEQNLLGTADAVVANIERVLAGDEPRWRAA